MKEFNNLKDECINAFNQFWNNCLENARKQLKKDGYIEIKEGIFKCLINNYSNLYLSDIANNGKDENYKANEQIKLENL